MKTGFDASSRPLAHFLIFKKGDFYDASEKDKPGKNKKSRDIPGTMQILRECVERGWYTAFIDAGAIVSTPTCGPCLGGYMGILAAGEKCVATTNRNFVGRMGHVESEVYLASPHTAAASALTGYITEYKEAE